MELAGIFRQALDLWQNPPFTELSAEAFMGCANRCITQHGIDLDLTPDAAFRTIKSAPFVFAGSTAREYEFEGDIDDISRINRVESRAISSSNEDDWVQESIAGFDNWNEILDRGDKDYVSFFGTPPAVTMVVARDVSSLEFRIVYRQLREKIVTPEEILELPNIYEPLLVYDLALEAGEVIDNQSPEFQTKKSEKMLFLMARRKDAMDRIDKWRLSQKGTKTSHRRAFNERGIHSNLGRRRFTVDF